MLAFAARRRCEGHGTVVLFGNDLRQVGVIVIHISCTNVSTTIFSSKLFCRFNVKPPVTID